MRRRSAALIAVTAIALTSACTTESDETEPAAQSTAPATEAADEPADDVTDDAADDTAPESDDEAAPAGDVTAPGTELSVGDTATTVADFGGEDGTIELTVASVTAGDPADLAELDLGDQVAGLVPYYIEWSATNLSDQTPDFVSLKGGVNGTLADGSAAQSLRIAGEFAPCTTVSSPTDFGPGGVWESCIVYLAPEAAEVTGAQYLPVDQDAANENYLRWTS